jgi:hypothetical protein
VHKLNLCCFFAEYGPDAPKATVYRELLVRMCKLVHDEFEGGIESDPEDVVVSHGRWYRSLWMF